MKKKMISLFLCGMMAVTAIVGCGGSGETKSEESGSEVVEIEFWYGLGGKLGETMESIINDFNETQDEVKVTGVQQSDYAETKRLVQSAIASVKYRQLFYLPISICSSLRKKGLWNIWTVILKMHRNSIKKIW